MARYFLATLEVLAGWEFAEAQAERRQAAFERGIALYEEVLSLPVSTAEQREVVELSRLAVARLHFELGRYEEAVDAYNRVPHDSSLFAEALYELSLIHI